MIQNASLLIHPSELSERWIHRIAGEGIPTLALHPEGGRKAHLSLRRLLEHLSDPDYRARLDRAAEMGLRIEYEMHAARYLLPADEFEAHPDWFRMNEAGQRSADFNCCASNEEALNYLSERAAALVKLLYRSTDRYYFWLDDERHTACHCPACAKLSASDQQLKILNRILLRLKQDNPNARLAYLAYFDTVTPPLQIAPEEGIFLEYAPFLRDFHRPVRESIDQKQPEELLAVFGKTNAKVLEYWYDNSMLSKWKKPPVAFAVDEQVLREDVRYYSELGFSELSSFACFLGEEYEALYGEPDVSAFGECYRAMCRPLESK